MERGPYEVCLILHIYAILSSNKASPSRPAMRPLVKNFLFRVKVVIFTGGSLHCAVASQGACLTELISIHLHLTPACLSYLTFYAFLLEGGRKDTIEKQTLVWEKGHKMTNRPESEIIRLR